MMPDWYASILSGCGGHCVELSREERWRLLQQWREIYAVGLHAATGQWKDGQFEWHVFCRRGHARALNGGKAAAAYEDERPHTIIVCPEDRQLPAARIVNGQPPNFRPESIDVLVWPEDLSWTMAFTHEESIGLGPFFSRREWVEVN